MTSSNFDVLIVGAGFAGITAARELAERGNKKVLVLERHDHIAGNCYDCYDEAGVLIHQYGPHIFHTYNKRVYEYLSRFTEWRQYQHCVVGNIHGMIMPIPFNLYSLHLAFEKEKADRLEKKLIDTFGLNQKVPILKLRESQDPEILEVAEYVYENVFLQYTMKQWGKKPSEIDPAVTGRVPVFLSRDNRYFQDPYQGMPLEGYTPLAQNMVNHPNITIRYGVDCRDVLEINGSEVKFEGQVFKGILIFTGQVDELYDRRFGMLPYRSLDFVFETHNTDFYQQNSVVNYPVSEKFTRITEFKYLTGQVLPGKTTTVTEYSKPYEGRKGEIPYYTISNPESLAMYQKYVDLVKQVPNFYLLGRLAEFKYYNIDGIVARALELCDEILSL